MKPDLPSYQASPLQLVAFNDVEDELFGAPGTPDRNEYEARSYSCDAEPLAIDFKN
jgi:hypothetical protein